jgi:hypothetical protein
MHAVSLAGLIPLSASLLLAAAAAPAQAQRSRAMAQECRGASADTPANRQRAEQWVQDRLRAFVPAREPALRMRSLELQAEQVKLAFYGISSTCGQYLTGKIAKEDADLSLSGFEETIANFLHDVGNETLVVAARAQVSDMPKIRQALTDIGGAGRQAALLGEDELAEQSRKKLVDALVSFSRAFVDDACYHQSFDPRIAMGLARQNELLGTGIDVTPCANREFTAEGKGADILWQFTHCGRGIGEWKIKTSGPLEGQGVATVNDDLSGTWLVNESSGQDVTVQYSGDLTVLLKPIEGDEDTKEPDRLSIRATQSSVTSEGKVFRQSLQLSGLSFVVKRKDNACRVGEGQ